MNNFSSATLGYLIATIASIILYVIYHIVFKGRENRDALHCYAAIFFVALGYFLMSISPNLEFSLFANRLVYLGSIILISVLTLIVANFCEIKIHKTLFILMIVCSALMGLLTFSGGTSIKLYYSSVSFEVINNTSVLLKRYGPLHNIYLGYVVLMYLIMIGITAYSIIRKGNKMPVNPVALTFVVLENILVWIYERYAGLHFELLAFSYVINGAVLILLYKNMEDYKALINPKEKVKKTVEEVVLICQKEYDLTDREMEVLRYLLDNVPRTEIAEKMFITEHTVKKHTSHIYEKMGITSRSELLHKLNEYLSS